VASYVVDGLVLPVSVGGHPVLDFCNTRAGWGAPTPKEYLHSYAHLARWAVENGLLSEVTSASPARGRSILGRALALRDALYRVLVPGSGVDDSETGDPGEREWAVIDREVRAAGPTLVANPDGPTPAAWRLDSQAAQAPLAAIAWAAGAFLTSPAAGTVGACPGEGCGWVFTDPKGRRRWCSMAWCGNRAKARRHAQRTRGTVGP
jgi:predicted RNA-binding Zn ribbon-like protein